jgi:hypothetical protein
MGNSLRRVLREGFTAAMVEWREERAEDCMRVGQLRSESKKSRI